MTAIQQRKGRSNMEQGCDAADELTASFFCKDPDSNHGEDCETFYRTDRDSWLVQGKRRGERVAAQLVALADDETFVEMSQRTVDLFVRTYVRETYGLDLGDAPGGTGLGRAGDRQARTAGPLSGGP
ncbi:hypothetical protein LO762_28435 [Actinocorallia sp. API 0066]|uniref:hypothetical protein n=1 Tax=Actinocorallia sp. API 0066 TaxID=2896846 RepID=UPI001E326D22|nr:hypothetical protein [Actinocorallia sp. API 0066]MCD0453081.1 hypothetical protein [Actinocorallia sp. API 0066]